MCVVTERPSGSPVLWRPSLLELYDADDKPFALTNAPDTTCLPGIACVGSWQDDVCVWRGMRYTRPIPTGLLRA
jgi:hypothetical protein